MIDFLFKSIACLAVFLGFYLLVLEREKTHQFNRFYLLLSIMISFSIPFITFEIIKPVITQTTIPALSQQNFTTGIAPAEVTINLLPYFLWTIYGIITSIFLFRFGNNFYRLYRQSKSEFKIKHRNASVILLNEKVLPHTFLNTIFVNKEDYHNRNIEEELYTHELVHVTQKHSLDVLFIELLKALFWFNPLLYFYKKSIQLNHEFLADEKVVNDYNNVPFYQTLLLQKGLQSQTIYLASNLNYLVTKKRLLMMTKKTSKVAAIFSKIALLPILSLLFYFFCVQVVAQQTKSNTSAETNAIQQKVTEKDYFAGARFKFYTNSYQDKNGARKGTLSIDKLYEELTEEDKEKFTFSLLIPKPFQKKSPTQKELDDFKNSKKYAIWIDGVNVENDKLNKFKPNDIAYFTGSSVLKNARTKKNPQPFQYSFYTHSFFDKNKMGIQKTKYDGKEIIVWSKTNDKIKEVQNVTEVVDDSKQEQVYNTTTVDKAPGFVGGMQLFYKFIGANYKISDELFLNKVNGKVFATFVIEKDGSLSNLKILRDIGYGTGEEAIRVLSICPKWLPGEKDGKPVRVQYNIPINIQNAEK